MQPHPMPATAVAGAPAQLFSTPADGARTERSSKMREEDVIKWEPLGNLAAAPGIAFEESPCMLKTLSTLYFDI